MTPPTMQAVVASNWTTAAAMALFDCASVDVALHHNGKCPHATTDIEDPLPGTELGLRRAAALARDLNRSTSSTKAKAAGIYHDRLQEGTLSSALP